MRRLVPLLALALAAAACGGTPPGSSPAPRRDASEISEQEVRASTRINAYDLIVSLRPGWLLRQATPTSLRNPEHDPPVVYLNGQLCGSIEQLRGFRTSEVTRVRWCDPVSAQQRFGRATGGVVELITRSGP